MAYSVKTQNFEGPFDLLLQLINKHKIDVCSISISEITDQYLSEVSKMVILDADTTSDFMSVAATLVEIKANALLPVEVDNFEIDDNELTPLEARELLISKLIAYKQFKNARDEFEKIYEQASKRVRRTFGATSDFKSVAPDFLRNVKIEKIARLAAEKIGRKDEFLLSSKHIAKKHLDVEVYVEAILSRCKVEKSIRFTELVCGAKSKEIVVVTLLAVLELYKRGKIMVKQDKEFDDIKINSLSA